MGSLPDSVEKLMSLDLNEFHRSLKTLQPGIPLEEGQTEVLIRADEGEVRIVYEPLEKATLGGLLALPRAQVTLHMYGLGDAERQHFLTRFDKAFQRGGG